MKMLLNNLFTLLNRYKTTNRRINAYATTFTVFKSMLFSFLISAIIISLPVAIILNMFIYTKLIFILSVLLVTVVMGWILLYYKFYFVLLTYYHEEIKKINLKYIFYIETSIINFLVLLIGIAVLSFLF